MTMSNRAYLAPASRRLGLAAIAATLLATGSLAEEKSLKDVYAAKGVSDPEWLMVLDARMPAVKIDQILAAGVSITEYFKYPWLQIGYTEQQWLKLRSAGLTAEGKPPRARGSAEWAVLHNFFLPGLHQFIRHQYAKAWSMTGVAVLSGGLFAYGIGNRKGSAIGVSLALLVPDALWSSIDIGLQVNQERNPDAERFTDRAPVREGVSVAITFPTPRR